MTSEPTVAAASQRLRAAGEALRARPPAEVLEALCQALELWRSPDSPWRARLEAELSTECGYSRATVKEGLARGLAHWSADALRSLVSRELGASPRRLANGFELTSVSLAGSIPMPSLLTMLLPLVLRSPVLVKPASRDPVTPRLFASSLAAVDAELARCLEVVAFATDDESSAAAFFASPCVVASGSDRTLERVALRVGPPQRLVGYGHRLSVAVLGRQASRGAALEAAARGLALDVALWDQLGCLSPVAVYVEDSDPNAARRTAEALAQELEGIETRLPRGEIAREAAAAIARERDLARMRDESQVLASPDTRWTVVREADARVREAPLHRFVRVHPVASGAALVEALRPLGPHLSGVAIAGQDAAGHRQDLCRRLAQLGASRICEPGQMQAPPLEWHHDGAPLLLPLARLCDLEV